MEEICTIIVTVFFSQIFIIVHYLICHFLCLIFITSVVRELAGVKE